jgi:excisionase family DNA binding protein
MNAKKIQAAEAVKPGSAARRAAGGSFQGSGRPLTVSVEKAAKLLGISRASAYTYAKAGVLPSVRLGTRLLVPKAALDRLLAGA